VIVDNLDIFRSRVRPSEYDPPLVVDSDRMLASQVTLKRLQPISWRHRQIVQNDGIVYLNPLPARDLRERLGRALWDSSFNKNRFRKPSLKLRIISLRITP
jgi:hypothetical protein